MIDTIVYYKDPESKVYINLTVASAEDSCYQDTYRLSCTYDFGDKDFGSAVEKFREMVNRALLDLQDVKREGY